MKFLSIFILLYIYLSIDAKASIDTIAYKHDFGLKGDVVSFEERVYSAKKNKEKIENKHFISNAKYDIIDDRVFLMTFKDNSSTTNYFYDGLKRLIEVRTISLRDGSLKGKNLYFYEQKQLIPYLELKYNVLGKGRGKGKTQDSVILQDSIVISYNEEKKELSTMSYSPEDGRLLYQNLVRYNENNKIDKKVKTTQEAATRFIYSFDPQTGKIIEEKWFLNNKLVQKIKYEYNKLAYLTKRIELDEYERPYSETEYTYDPISGSILEINQKQRKQITRYEYNFDDNENWILRYEFENNKPIRIVERKIQYK